MLSFTAGLVASLVLTACLSGCASAQQNVKTVKDVVQLSEDACVLIHDVAPDSKEGQEICAREAELVPYIKLILGARAHPKKDAGAPATGKTK